MRSSAAARADDDGVSEGAGGAGWVRLAEVWGKEGEGKGLETETFAYGLLEEVEEGKTVCTMFLILLMRGRWLVVSLVWELANILLMRFWCLIGGLGCGVGFPLLLLLRVFSPRVEWRAE